MRRFLVFIPLFLLTAGVGGAITLAVTDSTQSRPQAPPTLATASTTTTSTQPAELHIFTGTGGGDTPAFCSFGYPAKKWPPPPAPAVAAHLLTIADVPATMTALTPSYPTSGPSYDEFAVGYPQDPVAQADFAVPHTMEPASVDEILAQATSPQAAAAQVEFAVDQVYGQCIASDGGSPNTPFPLPASERSFVAFEQLSGTSYDSGASVVVFGAVGTYVFELEVGNLIAYPATGRAPLPTVAQVDAEVAATVNHLTTPPPTDATNP